MSKCVQKYRDHGRRHKNAECVEEVEVEEIKKNISVKGDGKVSLFNFFFFWGGWAHASTIVERQACLLRFRGEKRDVEGAK